MDKMTNTAATSNRLAQSLILQLVDANGNTTPLQSELVYDRHDPYAVTAVFVTVGGNVRWTFGRDLLIGGTDEPTGDGDVHVWPCLDSDGESVVMIELCSPDGEALVQARAADLNTFLARTVAAVAPGAESQYVDLDATIAAILAADAA